jgi:short-subunit dehydrogenase
MNERVMITGASSGIGKAFAYEYAGQGKDLILTARNRKKIFS